MKTITIKYGLYHVEQQKLLGYETTSNDGQQFCNELQYELTYYSDIPWCVDDARTAEWVRIFNIDWYNSSYHYPMCKYEPSELKVVELKTSLAEVDINIPSIYEFYERKYAESNPCHWERLKKDIEKVSPYNLYELDSIDLDH